MAKAGKVVKNETVGSAGRSSREKLNLVIEAKSISPKDQGKWLREKGLHNKHIPQYEQELRDLIQDKTEKQKKIYLRINRDN